ncbi:MAG: anaerobic ribonucleoside-triphosphate reductase activating protein [Desulfobacterales bacterium]|nr:MAG: anaerobic ribonucleoside-triphosphate reductase activating protein [Desulfobacterales bacterium]
MQIGGWQKNSLIDYPGKLSCVIFLAGCNFTCPYCHNPTLARGYPARVNGIEREEVYAFLENRRGFLDGVVISGGEPTLQPDLFSLCAGIKEMGYPVKLDTNGSRPRVLKALIDAGLIDYIAMDLKTAPHHYPDFIIKDFDPVPIFSSIRIIMESELAYEFRTTCLKPIVTDHAIRQIGPLIEGARLYVLQRFCDRGVLQPEFLQNNDYAYADAELMQLKTVAETWVAKCVVR